MFVENICTICKDECCVFELEDFGSLIYRPEDGYWWCGSCDCHSPAPWEMMAWEDATWD
jgi:hypothetical protein